MQKGGLTLRGRAWLQPLQRGSRAMQEQLNRGMRHSKAQLAFSLLVGIAVIVGLGAMLYNSRELLLTYDWRLRPVPLVASFLLYSVALILTVQGWGLLMARLGVEKSLRKHFYIYSLTILAQRLPGVFWHVLGRMALYQKQGVGKRTVAVVSGLELVLMLIAGILVTLLALPLMAPTHLNRPGLLLGGLLLGLLLVHPRTLRLLLVKLRVGEEAMPGIRYRHSAFLVGLYAIVWALGGLILFAIIMAVYPLPWNTLPGIVGAWSLSGVIASISTFTPSGFGLREISLSVLLTPFMPTGMSAVIAIVARAVLSLCELAWAFGASRLLSDEGKPAAEPEKS